MNLSAAVVASIVASLALLGCAALGYTNYAKDISIKTLAAQQADSNLKIEQFTQTLLEASSTIATLKTQLADANINNEALLSDLEREEEKNSAFAGQIKKLSGTVGRLDKLSKTDEELLQKYSKVYFLNENYIPSQLSLIDSKHILPGRSDRQFFHSDVLPFLNEMLADAADDAIELKIISAYRSFETQTELKGIFLESYGSGANMFSADQGFSEHQLGTTVDITDSVTKGTFTSFDTTKAFAWLEKNAYKYGFVLSYPKGNRFYVYEPWHWRFVGTDLARDLYKDKAHFYDWDQRKIDEYLISIFD